MARINRHVYAFGPIGDKLKEIIISIFPLEEVIIRPDFTLEDQHFLSSDKGRYLTSYIFYLVDPRKNLTQTKNELNFLSKVQLKYPHSHIYTVTNDPDLHVQLSSQNVKFNRLMNYNDISSLVVNKIK